MITALIAFILLAGLAAWRPALATAALVLLWPAYLSVTELFGIPTTVLEMSLYGATLGTMVAVFLKRWPRPVFAVSWWTTMLLLCWTVAWIVAVIASPDLRASLGAWKAWWLDAGLFAALLFTTVRSAAEKTLIIRAVVASGTVVAVAGLGQLAFLRDTLQEGRLSSFYAPVANYAAMYLAPIFVFGMALLVQRAFSRIWIGPLAIIGLALLGTQSLGGLLAVGAGLFIVWLTMPRGRLRSRLMWSAIVLATLFLSAMFLTGKLTQRFDFADRSSGSVRIQIWVTSWAIGMNNPILGIGPNAFEAAYRDELPKHYFPPLEWLVAQPHNLPLALWLELGLTGLVVFIGGMYYWFRSVFPLLRSTERRATAIAAASSVVAILAHGLIDTPVLKSDLMLMTVWLLVVPFLAREKSTN